MGYAIESEFWHSTGHVGEAILMATYLLNKIPRKEKEETPYELWMGRKPSYQYLRVWGCLAKVAVPTPKAQKIGPKSVDCIFIGYAKNSTGLQNKEMIRLQDERQDQTDEEEVEPRRSKRARNEKSFGPDFVSFMVENEPTSYREAITNVICVYIEEAAISWKSSKQTVIAKSTMESEFIALDKCEEEAEWLRQFVEDIPRWPKTGNGH
ncbi:retrotransposon protein, putative, ty1-copia subclass [Tanacetum coccineum]